MSEGKTTSLLGVYEHTLKVHGMDYDDVSDETIQFVVKDNGEAICPAYSPGFDHDNFCGGKFSWEQKDGSSILTFTELRDDTSAFAGPSEATMNDDGTIAVKYSRHCVITFTKRASDGD
mmetsp:Transcript_31614/g.44021  ORF Transcript_31614/g.44021 Transcript_31614/m.44021 type:complete len:119 (+) Transcript_31614:3-359(+)